MISWQRQMRLKLSEWWNCCLSVFGADNDNAHARQHRGQVGWIPGLLVSKYPRHNSQASAHEVQPGLGRSPAHVICLQSEASVGACGPAVA